jgi:riboflavin biosynthesis pyrimidine reductase
MTVSVTWLKPSPLWASDGSDLRLSGYFRPQIFEFRSDEFMEDFLAAAGSARKGALETHLAQPPATGALLKLFQPVHGCFYLAAASLCCRVPGMPDREVAAGEGETLGMVLRKVVDGVEYAWQSAAGGADGAKTWAALNGKASQLAKGEQRLPAFNLPASGGRLLRVGYLPVNSSETYAAAPAELVVNNSPVDVRIEELGARFTAPLDPGSVVDNLPEVDPGSSEKVALTSSVYLLVELWEFLEQHLPDLAASLRDDPGAALTGTKASEKTALRQFIIAETLRGSLSLATALQKVGNDYAALNQEGGANLANLGYTNDYNLKGRAGLAPAALDELLQKTRAALPEQTAVVRLPKLTPSAETAYVLRFVYERPQCDPPVVMVSQPSQPFRLAPFFDPDAPARPVKIPLPNDVSIAGMRKFKKGVTFMMSDAMRRKMDRLLGKEKTMLSDNPELNSEGSGGIAFICSFSIQIIFIIAFMLLLIFVVVFNLIFWWLAFFKICLPVPKKLVEG